MKLPFLKFISVTLAVLTLMVSFNWSVNAHYCGNELINFSFFGEAEGCGMEEFDEICSSDSEDGETFHKTCCLNKDLVFDAVDQVRKINSLTASNIEYYCRIITSELASWVITFERKTSGFPNAPPLADKSVQILYQVFII
ncbi:MAG: hypothetical protein CL840_17310 [Crocinitomicaceae bacterium]|nr:hypothetical protein [Crocinitomicaceae bacterium]|tara:strand:+ start:87 stop:509 length:423 start_codon:yes stop_codon:yes gene_type:complete